MNTIMLIVHDLAKAILGNRVATGFRIFVLTLLFIAVPIAAQPGVYGTPPNIRKYETQRIQERIDELTESIKKDDRNTALYKRRLELYNMQIERNYDNRYSDKVKK